MSSENDDLTNDDKLSGILIFIFFTLLAISITGCFEISYLRKIAEQLVELNSHSSEAVDRLSAIERREWSAFTKAKLVPACESNPDGSYDTVRGQHVSSEVRELSGIDCPEAR